MNTKELFDRFKKACPNSKATFDPTPSNIASWKMHIANTTKYKRFAEANHLVVDKDKLKSFNDLIYSRRITSIGGSPQYIQDKLKARVEFIINNYDFVYEIYIEGSYAKGYYIDDQTTAGEKAILSLFIDTTKISDFDFSVNGINSLNNYNGEDDIVPRTGSGSLIWQVDKGFI